MGTTSKAIPGFVAKLSISDDAGVTFKEVAEIREVTLNIEQDMINVTSHDTAPDEEFIDGLRRWTVSAGGLYVTTDQGQRNVEDALLGDVELEMRYDPEGTVTGKVRYTGNMRVTSIGKEAPNDDAAAQSLEFQGTGVLARSLVP